MSESEQESDRDQEIEAADDVEADPAMDAGSTEDWSGEGGAVPDGPATETSDG